MIRINKWVHQDFSIQDQYKKSTAFLYTCNKQSKNETKKNNFIYNSIRKNKIIGINLIKEVQTLYSENYKTLLKEIRAK